MKTICITILILSCHTVCLAGNLNGQEYLNKIRESYLNQEYFSCIGEVQDINYTNGNKSFEEKVNFEIKMNKPNKLLIKWRGQSNLSGGAIWSDEGKYYFYDTRKGFYHQFKTPENALVSAAGSSLAASFRIASFFLESYRDKKNWLSELRNPKLAEENDQFTKIVGSYKYNTTDKKYVIEINPMTHLIQNYSSSSEYTKSSKKEVDSLLRLKERILQTKEKQIRLYTEQGINNPSEYFQSGVDKIDQSIKEAKERPEVITTHLVTEKAIFNNLSTNKIPDKDFVFHIPENTVFKGDSLDKFHSNN